MLDYNVTMLVGDKAASIKLANPKKYGFNAERLLQLLADVYVNMLPRSGSDATNVRMLVHAMSSSIMGNNFEGVCDGCFAR